MRNARFIISMLATCIITLPAYYQMSIAVDASAPHSESMPIFKGFSVQLTLGLKDNQPTNWTGTIKVSEGRLIRLDAQLGKNDWLRGNAWRLRTRRIGRRQRGAVRPVQLTAVFDAPADAKVEVTTQQGNFSFIIGKLVYGKRALFLNGAVAVERVPPTIQITTQPTEDDFPACAMAPDGTVWCAYVAYQHGNPIVSEEVNRGKFDSLVTKGNGDQVRLIYFNGKTWSSPMNVTDTGLDVWRPAVAVDGEGNVWVIWSQNVNGNWDLYARNFNPKTKQFSSVKQLTTAPGADINVVAVSMPDGAGDARGEVWLAWQGWRQDNFDIWLAQLSPDGLSQPYRVSTSTANDWSPAIAVTSNGHIWIAWDTYDKGDYDVYVRRFANGQLSAPIPIAVSPRFEARPSIAVDNQNRIWIAYEDAAPNWGKDFGTRWVGKSGVHFYLDRYIIVRCITPRLPAHVQQTKAQVKSMLINMRYPSGPRHRISFPRLCVDDEGRLWLLFRRHPLPTGSGEQWISIATYYDGDGWSQQITVPYSYNTLDNRPALLALSGKGLLIVHSSDGRTIGTRTAKENNLYATLLDVDGDVKPPALITVNPKGNGQSVEPVHPNELEDIQRIRSYRITIGGRAYQLLRGEFHRHTEISSHRDQDGSLEALWRYGLDVARMDWIGPGDHDYGFGREYTWWLTQKQIDIYHHPPVFVPMFTYERSVRYPSGHRNVMFAKRGIRALPRLGQTKDLLYGTQEKGAPDVKNLYAYLKFFDGICAVHTSATNMGTDWRDNDPAVEPVVEIYQGLRQNYEEPSAPLAAKNAQDSIGGYRPAGFVWNALAKGYRLGFQVSSDHVSTHISYAIVLAERATREAILDAFKQRHSYGANDNIILDVRCGNHLMGDEFELNTLPKLNITAIGTAPIARVDIVRQIGNSMPIYVYNIAPKRRTVKFTWMDKQAKVGEINMYYIRIRQTDGKLAWSSPMWIRYRR
ncbi:MAG TPA: hypothetical protein EYP10_11025 [Armatimonadetes bacterium]|nr:hypothetical protein [Armatimonadota bacterium]